LRVKYQEIKDLQNKQVSSFARRADEACLLCLEHHHRQPIWGTFTMLDETVHFVSAVFVASVTGLVALHFASIDNQASFFPTLSFQPCQFLCSIRQEVHVTHPIAKQRMILRPTRPHSLFNFLCFPTHMLLPSLVHRGYTPLKFAASPLSIRHEWSKSLSYWPCTPANHRSDRNGGYRADHRVYKLCAKPSACSTAGRTSLQRPCASACGTDCSRPGRTMLFIPL